MTSGPRNGFVLAAVSGGVGTILAAAVLEILGPGFFVRTWKDLTGRIPVRQATPSDAPSDSLAAVPTLTPSPPLLTPSPDPSAAAPSSSPDWAGLWAAYEGPIAILSIALLVMACSMAVAWALLIAEDAWVDLPESVDDFVFGLFDGGWRVIFAFLPFATLLFHWSDVATLVVRLSPDPPTVISGGSSRRF